MHLRVKCFYIKRTQAHTINIHCRLRCNVVMTFHFYTSRPQCCTTLRVLIPIIWTTTCFFSIDFSWNLVVLLQYFSDQSQDCMCIWDGLRILLFKLISNISLDISFLFIAFFKHLSTNQNFYKYYLTSSFSLYLYKFFLVIWKYLAQEPITPIQLLPYRFQTDERV